MKNRVAAWLNLAYHFGIHVLFRMPSRWVRVGKESQRFLGAVLPEGYQPLTADERAAMPSFTMCIHCGLCALACPIIREAPAAAWDEAWTFVAGPSRSIDRASLVVAPPCAHCAECEAVCPTGVPITRLAAMLNGKSKTES
jgi:succinate dehydrogenase/fumarate reductase-like Fe-S protein